MLSNLMMVLVSAATPTGVTCAMDGVVTVDGVAAAGVPVSLRREVDFITEQTWRGVSDAQGKFSFAPVSEGWYRLSASRKDKTPAGASFLCGVDSAPATHTLALSSGTFPIRGRVTDRTGGPLADTEVSIVEVSGGKDEKIFRVAANVDVDDKGDFELRVPEGHSYRVYALAPGYSFQARDVNRNPGRKKLVTHVPLNATEAELSFQLAQEPVVTGRVTSGGKPVANARVFAGPMELFSGSHTTTDASGNFRLPVRSVEHLERKRTPVTTMTLCASSETTYAAVQVATPKEGADVNATLQLNAGGSVKGTLTLDGKPLPLATIFYRQPKSGLWGKVSADASGHFSVSGLDRNEEVTLFAAGGKHHEVRVRPDGPAVLVPYMRKKEER